MTSATMSETITLEQLTNLNTPKSLWVAVHGRVYDLTTFSMDHPGGIDVLKSCAGTDGTEAYEYAGHSEENMVKMQEYYIGRLARRPEPPQICDGSVAEESRRNKSTPSCFQHLVMAAWMKMAITLSATGLILALSYRYLLFALDISKFKLTTVSDYRTGHAFWAGVAIASSVSFVGFRYLYKLFLSSLDYDNDVFNLPPTIPRKTRR